MEFRETLLAAQRNQQEKSSASSYYKARFDPPKKEQKRGDRLSANIQKFLAKKDEEEKQKKLEAQRKRDELLAMRDPKALRKIQKTLKVIKSANKSVIEDAVDREHTAITLQGPEQPDQDDYGYESQEAAALYQKMMQKYSKIPDEPKFPVASTTVKKDLNGTRERVKHALQHEDDPVPHKRRRRTENGDKELTPPPKESEKRKEDQKPDKPKIRKPMPPPMDFNQLLKLAEQKKSEPIEVAGKKMTAEQEAERLMTKKQKREYEEEMARRQRRQERLEAEKAGGRKAQKEDRHTDRDKKPESSGFGRIPKLSDKTASSHTNERSKSSERDKYDSERLEKLQREKDRQRLEREKAMREKSDRERSDRERSDRERSDRDKINREKLEKEKLDRERLDKMRAERERLDREIERLNRDRERLDKTRTKLESKSSSGDKSKSDKPQSSRDSSGKEIKKNIDLKSQNTYRIDKNSDKKFTIPNKNSNGKYPNGHVPNEKPVPKISKEQLQKDVRDKVGMIKQKSSLDGSPKLNGRTENGKRPLENGKVPLKSDRPTLSSKTVSGSNKEKMSNSFDFDKHVNSLKPTNGVKRPDGGRQFPPGDVRRKMQSNGMKGMPKRRAVDSDSEYDSEMDDFIDDGDVDMDYSRHIKEIFGYDKSKYRDMDDDDDPMMESSFARQQREEYISKKIGIMEDLEDMKMEAMEKKRKKKSRRLSDD